MTATYAQFNTRAEAQAWIAEVDIALGYPDPVKKTNTFSYIIDGDDGLFYVPVTKYCPAAKKAKLAKEFAPSRLTIGELGKVEKIDGVAVKKK